MAIDLEQHQVFMRRAIELAQLGLGSVSPNPLVGCVIVKDGVVIGEGWHRKYGEGHAEVNAVNAVKHAERLKGATVYVTLEPCSHFGKTQPCADLLIEKKVAEVIVAVEDPNPQVAGQGIVRLKQAGIEVQVGLLAEEAEWMNRRFLTAMRDHRPYIILKWAQTMDGFVARENHDSKWISNAYSRMLVHKWRTEEDAILVGSNTVVYDDPQLTARDWPGKNPVRVVLDPGDELDGNYHVLDGSVSTIIYTTVRESLEANLELVKVDAHHYLSEVLADLHRKNIRSVIIEGGAKTLESFIEMNLWDEARVFYAPTTFTTGIRAPVCGGTILSKEDILGDTLIIYTRD
ncbi:MAG: bifunctional diaminohydroxyphosphoribosylaminopyrimidine deaminase/5-amino-6-(5-phosphoribosylamino)uracil reductase RibD [Imperialibacter sp.]|uniref:bifunctional diaminohydroxyphosphoribosylaminopyrimidine deaminase/5-amino-6-(5-phosphoribosylamino)uracil reductase RibD n=1 Tax=Imperialibacter sp. TaxID=2038411 RepID=UPI003A842815